MLITKDTTDFYARRNAGGKGYNLYRLTRAGLRVPTWVVLGADVFETFKTESNLNETIREILETQDNLKAAAAAIREAILKAPFPEAVEKSFKQAYQAVDEFVIAVRSSALDEDSAQHSFAGQLSSFLFVSNEDSARESLRECWASAYSERGLVYRKQNNLAFSESIGVGVVFQQMVSSEKSGVLFTCDPIKQDTTTQTINAVYGVGEGLVSGLLDGDTYVLDKKTGEIQQEELANKTSKVVRKEHGDGIEEVPVDPALHDVPALSPEELTALRELGNKVEESYRFPQDIEWGIEDGELYLLQSRPVTSALKSSEGELHIWDNSNIIESYGGITLPLTFTFARNVYHQVYVQFCELLMVPASEIRKMNSFLKNMLGSMYGRVFYNILNWYKLTSILPGFKYNRGFMETMMGTAHSLESEIAERVRPPSFQDTFGAKVRRFITGFRFLYFHWTIEGMVRYYLKDFHEKYDFFRAKDYSRMPADEIYHWYKEAEIRFIQNWHTPIINDYLTMVHFGLLKKLTGAWLGHLGDSLQNDLLCGEGNIESAEPTRELMKMAAAADKIPGLKKLLLDTPKEDCLEALNQSEHQEFYQRVWRYIDLYGFRCMSEMKLEQPDLHQDPSFLFVVLKNYLRSGKFDLASYEEREQKIRQAAEATARKELSGLKKIVYFWSLKHARRAVRNRENTRFCRTRLYGVGRAMFYGIGRDYVARNIIDKPIDIFYLTLDELRASMDGYLTVQNLRRLVKLRREEYESYEEYEPAARIITRGPVYWMNDICPVEEVEIPEDLPENCIAGIGCCPGQVEGVVKVINNPDDDMELNGEILVTIRTDPGWIPLYPSLSGLLVERGGLLSHSAIVAREMGLPTVVGVKGLNERLKTGMKIRFDGKTGIIEILEEAPETDG